MNNTLFGTGIACIIAAIVGGGLKAFGIEIPLLNSVRRQILLGIFGIVLILIVEVPTGYSSFLKWRARVATRSVQAKLNAIRFLDVGQQENAHDLALLRLRVLTGIEREIQTRSTIRNSKTVSLTQQEITQRRKQEQQALHDFRQVAQGVIPDWQAAVDSISLTEVNLTTIGRVGSLESLADKLTKQVQHLKGVRDDLELLISIAATKEEQASLSVDWQRLVRPGLALQKEGPDKLKELATCWDEIDSQLTH